MKLHLKIFLISSVLMIVGYLLHEKMALELSVGLVEQAKAISYIVSMIGIVMTFSWYKRKAVPVKAELDTESDEESIRETNKIASEEAKLVSEPFQKKVYMSLLAINIINALILIVCAQESIKMMCAMTIMVVLISPIIFRSMHDK